MPVHMENLPYSIASVVSVEDHTTGLNQNKRDTAVQMNCV